MTGHRDNDFTNDTEIINLYGNCSTSLGNYPAPQGIYQANGVFMNDSVIVCGGFMIGDDSVSSNDCYKLFKRDKFFRFFAKMQERRKMASITVIQGNLWITGGKSASYVLKSTEFLPPKNTNSMSTSVQKIDLPEPLYGHVVINLNETTSFLIGGATTEAHESSKSTYYFNHASNSWTEGPDLFQARRSHTVGIIKDNGNGKEHIAVVGGLSGYINVISIELMFSGENVWSNGTVISTITNSF